MQQWAKYILVFVWKMVMVGAQCPSEFTCSCSPSCYLIYPDLNNNGWKYQDPNGVAYPAEDNVYTSPNCYKFIRVPKGMRSCNDTQRECEKVGGKITIINSINEYGQLTENVLHVLLYGYNSTFSVYVQNPPRDGISKGCAKITIKDQLFNVDAIINTDCSTTHMVDTIVCESTDLNTEICPVPTTEAMQTAPMTTASSSSTTATLAGLHHHHTHPSKENQSEKEACPKLCMVATVASIVEFIIIIILFSFLFTQRRQKIRNGKHVDKVAYHNNAVEYEDTAVEMGNHNLDNQQGFMTHSGVDGCNLSSFQPDSTHGQVSPRDIPANQTSLKCSSVSYQPEMAQNWHSLNSQSTKVHTPVQPQSSNQLERLPEDQPSCPTGNPQPVTTEAESALAIGQMEKPGMLTTSLQSQVTPSQGTTAVTTVVATAIAAATDAVSVPSATKSRVCRKGDRPLSKVKVIDIDMINFIKCNVIKQRKELARELGFTDADIDIIEANIGHGDVKEIVHQIMATWRQKEGERATPDKLMKALQKIELNYVAQEFCKQFNQQINSSELETPGQDQYQQCGTAPTQDETPRQPQPPFHVPDRLIPSS